MLSRNYYTAAVAGTHEVLAGWPIPVQDRIELAIEAWLLDKYALTQSKCTATAYRDALRSLRVYLLAREVDLDSSATDIASHLHAWASLRTSNSKRQGEVAPSTYNQRIAVVSSFYCWAMQNGFYHEYNPTLHLTRATVQKYAHARTLDPQTVRSKLKDIDRSTPRGWRDYTLLQVALNTGRSAQELASLTWHCIQREEDYVILISEGPQYVSPMEAPNTLANAPASHLAIRAKARALNTTIATGQCAGLDTLGYAAKAIREERARQIIVGAVGELSPAALWVYRNSRVLPTEHSENAGRPYSEESSGWLPGEGAAVLVVERQDAAQARGIRPLAELLGWSSGFAPTASLEKRAQVLRRVAQQALDVAGVTAEDINVVLAGASGWQQQDQAEALALRGLLAHNSHVAVTAIKGTLGETYGAGGLFQAVAAVNIIQHGIVPPTLGGGSLVEGLLSEARTWPGSKQGTALLLTQDLFGSTSAVVLRGFQA